MSIKVRQVLLQILKESQMGRQVCFPERLCRTDGQPTQIVILLAQLVEKVVNGRRLAVHGKVASNLSHLKQLHLQGSIVLLVQVREDTGLQHLSLLEQIWVVAE